MRTSHCFETQSHAMLVMKIGLLVTTEEETVAFACHCARLRHDKQSTHEEPRAKAPR